MAFVNASLLMGGLLAAVPIILHLVMRQRPRQLVFPALRFLAKRRETNRRKLQLRHWLLLALRCLIIGLLVLAFARPSVSSALVGRWAVLAFLAVLTSALLVLWMVSLIQRRGRALLVGVGAVTGLLLIVLTLLIAGTLRQSRGVMLGDREAPVSAVLLFDTSPRMEYHYHNQTRLEAAQEIADWLIRQLPADSQIAVVDSRVGPAVFAVDLAAATKAIERLETTGVSDPLPTVLERVLRLVSTGRHPRKEVYVLSDLTAASWPTDSPRMLAQPLERMPETSLYVIDVGVTRPSNFALGRPRLSSQSLTANNELELTTELRCIGSGGEKVVELFLEEPDADRPLIVDGEALLPVARRIRRADVSIDEGEARQVQFRLPILEPGVHQGYLAITGTDGLTSDDVRYFAVEVREAWPVLVAAPRGVHTELFTEAIAPYEHVQAERARFDCTVVLQTDLANRSLNHYSVVCLVDPQPLPPANWDRLRRYVEGGGSLAVFLGVRAQPLTSFQTETARRLLGGKMVRQWRAGGRDLFLAPDRYDHPILAVFRPYATSVPWNQSPILRHWVLDPLQEDTHVVLPYGNGKPALLETTVGDGRVLVMTTPVSEPSRPGGREAWNELPTSEEAWPYVVLVTETMIYLSGSGESHLNYLTGETAVLANDPDDHPQRYQLFTPREEPQEVTARDGRLVVKFTERPGAYRLKGNRGGPIVRGFAVNLPPEASDLSRLPREELDRLLGENRYQLARSREEIVREVGETRVGREFYPYLIAMLAVMLALEYLLGNRFYRRHDVDSKHESVRNMMKHEPAA
ncbi:MAG: BatA domain-containing protein [Pirellulaceae bacterium]